jgi:hypothetical protein
VKVFLEMWNRRSPPFIKSTTRYLIFAALVDASSRYETLGPCSHIFDILETVTQIANELVIQVLQHPPLPYYVPHALRSNDCVPKCQRMSSPSASGSRAFIFADILQGERQPSILPFHNSNLPKCTLSDNPQQSEVIEVHCKKKQLLARSLIG